MNREVSKHLPETMYLYQVDSGYPGDDDYIPPRVYDHGKVHLSDKALRPFQLGRTGLFCGTDSLTTTNARLVLSV